MLDRSGRTALVTGASAGIGREIARLLAKDVARLVIVARRKDRLDELAAELRAANPRLVVDVRAVDLLDRVATGAMLDQLEKDHVAIDVFVNNAGFGDRGFFEDLTWEKNLRLLELNVVTATYLLHRLVPPMITRGAGAILNVGSSAGMLPGVGSSTYAASKAYVNHLSEALAAELRSTGVTVTTLCPGPVPTEFQGGRRHGRAADAGRVPHRRDHVRRGGARRDVGWQAAPHPEAAACAPRSCRSSRSRARSCAPS